jgi:hypothetical protein
MDGFWWSIVVIGVVVAICGNEKKDGEFYEQEILERGYHHKSHSHLLVSLISYYWVWEFVTKCYYLEFI